MSEYLKELHVISPRNLPSRKNFSKKIESSQVDIEAIKNVAAYKKYQEAEEEVEPSKEEDSSSIPLRSEDFNSDFSDVKVNSDLFKEENSDHTKEETADITYFKTANKMNKRTND